MKTPQFLEHHGIAENPFAEEDAQTDHVFKDHCISSTFHPTWDKVFGNPAEPATSVVFGEKGSGKTAMRLQIARHLESFNSDHPHRRVFVIHYDDLNPFLDRFCERLSSRKRRRLDRAWRNGSCGITWMPYWRWASLGWSTECWPPRPEENNRSDGMRSEDVDRLQRHEARDLLLLAACYDQSTSETFKGRWQKLRRRLHFRTLTAYWPLATGVIWTVVGLLAIVLLFANGYGDWLRPCGCICSWFSPVGCRPSGNCGDPIGWPTASAGMCASETGTRGRSATRCCDSPQRNSPVSRCRTRIAPTIATSCC